jgi:hypothetical protein
MYLVTHISYRRKRRTCTARQKKNIDGVDAALFAIREIMEDHPEALFYGQE